MPSRPIHLLGTDGNLACSGASLQDAASDTAPPRITIHLCDVTCARCLCALRRQSCSSS